MNGTSIVISNVINFLGGSDIGLFGQGLTGQGTALGISSFGLLGNVLINPAPAALPDIFPIVS